MGKYLFNPFTRNFTIIPKPSASGLFVLSARNGNLEWLNQRDPMLKTVTLDFSSTANQFISTAGILPRVQIARGDLGYAVNITEPNLYSHEVLLGTAGNTSTYSVGLYLAPDQGAEIRMIPSVAVSASPISDSNGNNVAFLYLMTFNTDATVNILAYEVEPPPFEVGDVVTFTDLPTPSNLTTSNTYLVSATTSISQFNISDINGGSLSLANTSITPNVSKVINQSDGASYTIESLLDSVFTIALI